MGQRRSPQLRITLRAMPGTRDTNLPCGHPNPVPVPNHFPISAAGAAGRKVP